MRIDYKYLLNLSDNNTGFEYIKQYCVDKYSRNLYIFIVLL